MDDKSTIYKQHTAAMLRQPGTIDAPPLLPLSIKNSGITLYLHLDDRVTQDHLGHHINKCGYKVSIMTHDFQSTNINLESPSALITALSQAGSEIVTNAIKHSIPVIFTSDSDTIETRLKSVRANGNYFLPLPFNPSALSYIINKATTPLITQSYKVLIIDDDELLATFHEIVLRHAKMEAKKLHQPLLALEILNEFKPDLILMDLYMPSCSGAELARIIRQEEKYSGIPIVFLSTESDIQEQMAAMEFGGDDFLLKPVTPERLVAAISTRAMRASEANHASTRLKTIAKELDDALVTARSSEVLKSKLIATMSHEVRTPINGMLGILDKILQSRLSSEQKELTEIVLSSTKSLLVILNDTLDFSKLEAGKMSLEDIRFNLHKTIYEVEKLFSDAASSKGLTLKSSLSDDLPKFIFGDPIRLKQILINLTNNAIKFTDSGTINIEVSVVENHLDQIKLLFNIIDSGIGINEKQQKLIFDEYAQAEQSISRTYGGTGLGLSICKKLVSIMGGEIDVSSKPNAGSTFWFTAKFKVANQTETDPPEKSNTIIDFSSINPAVLIVEDNRVNQMIISGYLQKHGIKAEVANNGKIAVEKMINGHYHLVFMDCQMPIMDGYIATQMIRESERQSGRPPTPIIAMTGNTLPGDREKCNNSGMDDYLSKPISKEQLAALLEKWLTYR